MEKKNEIKDRIDNKFTTNKKSPTSFEITILIIFFVFVIYGAINRDKISSFFNSNETMQTESKEVDKTFVVYDDNNILVKITDYEYRTLTNRLKITFYIENNSETETTFSISKDIAINNYMVEGGFLYENIKPHAKKIKEITLDDLEKYNLNKENIKEMKFNFDIYHSEHYIITNRIIDNQEFVYEFRR